MATAEAVRERPAIFSAPMIRAILAGKKSQTRRVVSPSDSTVLGYPAKGYWPHLLFDHAVPREQASLAVVMFGAEKAPRDVHLSVPYRYPGDPPRDDVRDLPWYRVRPIWEEGDRLYVKETWQAWHRTSHEYDEWEPITRGWLDDRGLADATAARAEGYVDSVAFRADGKSAGPWVSPIFMPRWASRLTLEIESVRVERLQSITEEDAIAEGVDAVPMSAVRRQATFTRRADFAQLWDKINGKKPGCSWDESPWVWAITFRVVAPAAAGRPAGGRGEAGGRE